MNSKGSYISSDFIRIHQMTVWTLDKFNIWHDICDKQKLYNKKSTNIRSSKSEWENPSRFKRVPNDSITNNQIVDVTLDVHEKQEAGCFWKFGYQHERWCFIDLKYFEICNVATSSFEMKHLFWMEYSVYCRFSDPIGTLVIFFHNTFLYLSSESFREIK